MLILPEQPVEDLQKQFTKELKSQMKKAAKRLKCPVEELKYRVTNAGIVEIARMDQQEMFEMRAQDAQDAVSRKVRKERGALYDQN